MTRHRHRKRSRTQAVWDPARFLFPHALQIVGEDPHFDVLIEAEHAHVFEAIARGDDEVDIDGWRVDPTVFLLCQRAVAQQLLTDDPPAMTDATVRMLNAGVDRRDILHMLLTVVLVFVGEAQRSGAVDMVAYAEAFDQLPKWFLDQRAASFARRPREPS